MDQHAVQFVPYDSLPQDGFQIEIPFDWEEYHHSEPEPGDSYYYYPAPESAGGFSVYISRSERQDVLVRLSLERELVDSLEIISKTKVVVDGRPADRLIYRTEETIQAGTIVDEKGLLVHTEEERHLMYADFCFVDLGFASFVFGYKLKEEFSQQYQTILKWMLSSMKFVEI